MLITFFSGSGIFPPFRGFRLAIGEARSTVFLDSCSTGQQPKNGGDPLAQLVADALPGVEVHAFEDVQLSQTCGLVDVGNPRKPWVPPLLHVFFDVGKSLPDNSRGPRLVSFP